MVDVYIGLGSNVGDKEENIRKAVDLIKERCKALKVSSLYETEPVGYEDQDWFLNCVLKGETDLDPQELLGFLQSIEKKLGRVRTIKDGPRSIDLDILFYGDRVVKKENLTIPHPRLHERGFVLIPLLEIEPNLTHPTLRRTVKELSEVLGEKKAVSRINESYSM